MDRYPTAGEVLDSLGDKVVEALCGAVAKARQDLTEYRSVLPGFVAESSARGLASWIHDRMWARARQDLVDVDGVQLVESGPTRDIFIRTDFRMRLKRHSPLGAIRSYPTAAALDFISQPEDLLSLIGIRTFNLTAGYEWDDMTQEIGEPVLSLRDGSFDEAIWVVALQGPAAASSPTLTPIIPRPSDPVAPEIGFPGHRDQRAEGTDG